MAVSGTGTCVDQALVELGSLVLWELHHWSLLQALEESRLLSLKKLLKNLSKDDSIASLYRW